MNGNQWDQSSFTVGGETSKQYRDNFDRIFGRGEKAAPDFESAGEEPGRAIAQAGEASGVALSPEQYTAPDSLTLNGLRMKLEALAESWIHPKHVGTGDHAMFNCGTELLEILRGEK